MKIGAGMTASELMQRGVRITTLGIREGFLILDSGYSIKTLFHAGFPASLIWHQESASRRGTKKMGG
jgi:hypothetical protein